MRVGILAMDGTARENIRKEIEIIATTVYAHRKHGLTCVRCLLPTLHRYIKHIIPHHHHRQTGTVYIIYILCACTLVTVYLRVQPLTKSSRLKLYRITTRTALCLPYYLYPYLHTSSTVATIIIYIYIIPTYIYIFIVYTHNNIINCYSRDIIVLRACFFNFFPP